MPPLLLMSPHPVWCPSFPGPTASRASGPDAEAAQHLRFSVSAHSPYSGLRPCPPEPSLPSAALALSPVRPRSSRSLALAPRTSASLTSSTSPYRAPCGRRHTQPVHDHHSCTLKCICVHDCWPLSPASPQLLLPSPLNPSLARQRQPHLAGAATRTSGGQGACGRQAGRIRKRWGRLGKGL